MVVCNFFLQGRCRYGERCWNEHPRGGRRQEQSRDQYHYQQSSGEGRDRYHYQQNSGEGRDRYHYQQSSGEGRDRYNNQQSSAGSRTWASSNNQRYVQPSNFSKSNTWSRDNNQASYSSHSDSYDHRSKQQQQSGSTAGHFSSQNRFSNLSSQDSSREKQSDKDGNLLEDIKCDLEAWESSGQWIFSSYCAIKDARNLTGFDDISPEELRLEFYTSRDSGNVQNYVNSVQQLATQWKQRIHAIRNTNISSQSTLIEELFKPVTSSAPMLGGQQNSAFPTASSSTGSAAPSSVNFSFKLEPQNTAPTVPVASFPGTSGFGPGNAAVGSAASFTFAVTTSSGVPSSSSAAASLFSGFSTAPTATNTSSTGTSVFGAAATSGFGQSTTLPGFGSASVPSGFGMPSNTVTSGFGASTSAVANPFPINAASSAPSVPFGQPSAPLVSHAPSVTTAGDAGSANLVYTPRSQLSTIELSQFEAKRFTLGNIPVHPPPAELLIV